MGKFIANKENKTLGLALRICLIVTWLMTNISVFVLLSGFANFDKGALDSKNPDKQKTAQEVLKIIGDLGSKTTLYYVTFGLIAVCLALAVISRYKTKTVSYVFKIIFLLFSISTMAGGFEFLSALRSCKGLSALSATGTSKDAVAQALSSAGFSGNAADTANILTSKEQVGNALGGYLIPLFVLFVIMITSIHCLVKKKDPNAKSSSEE